MTTDFFIINIALFFLGLYLLTKSSDKFVDSAVYFAKIFGISEIVIGLTLVSIGTSLPELATNIYAAITNNPGIAFGNALGSNITNILLALGGVILIKNLKIAKKIFYRDVLTMNASFILFAIFIYTHNKEILYRYQGIILLTLCILYTLYLVKNAKTTPISSKDLTHDEEKTFEDPEFSGKIPALICLIISVGLISFGAKVMVDNIVWIADKFKIPNSIISATIIAIGTSLPEIAVTISGVKKSKPDIILGNIIGSCTYNLLLVLGVTVTIRPLPIDKETYYFLTPFMLLTGFLCMFFMSKKFVLKRIHGIIFITLYVAFLGINVYKAIIN